MRINAQAESRSSSTMLRNSARHAKPLSRRLLALAALSVLAAGGWAGSHLHAATQTWAPGGVEGAGNWDATTSNWNPGSTTWSNGNTAVFGLGGSGSTPFTVTIDTTGIAASSLTFNTGAAYTIAASGSYSLTLNNGGSSGTVDINVNNNATIIAPINFDSNIQISGNKTLTLTSSSTSFASGVSVTIGNGSTSNVPTLVPGNSSNGPATVAFDGGTLVSDGLGGGGGFVLNSLGGTGIINTFDANANASSDVKSQINQVGAATFVLQDGTISLTQDNSSTFTAGTLQIGNGSLATDVLFGYQVSSVNNNNLPASNVAINLDGGTLTQASTNGPNGEIVDTSPNTIANNISLTGTGDAVNPGTVANMRLKITGVITGGNSSPIAFNSDGSTSGVELSGNNTYSGGTTINAGNVRVDTNSAFGTGAVTLNPTTFSSIQYGVSGLSIANSLVLDSVNEMNLAMHGNSGTWSGVISGSGTGGLTITDFTNTGAQLTLSNTNTYTGPTIVGDSTNAVSLNLTGSLQNSNITILSHASMTGTGRLNWNLANNNGDLITANGGLTITNLNLDVHATGSQTQSDYVVANYSAGNLTGSSFASVAGLLAGWTIN